MRGERQGGGTGWSESSGGARGFRAGRSQGLSRARWLPVQCSLLASPAGKGESSAPRSAPQQYRLCLAPGRCLLSPRPSSVTPTLHPVHQQDAHCPASRCCRAHTSHLGRGSERAGVMVEHGVTRQLMTIGRGSAPLCTGSVHDVHTAGACGCPACGSPGTQAGESRNSLPRSAGSSELPLCRRCHACFCSRDANPGWVPAGRPRLSLRQPAFSPSLGHSISPRCPEP